MPPASKRKRGTKSSGKGKRGGKKSKEFIDSDSDEVGGEDGGASEWVVEEVVGKRIVPSTGKIEYFLKWKNWPPSTNTWEPVEHLNCPELVAAYEASLLAASRQDNNDDHMDDRPNGFDDGLTTRAVRGCVQLDKNGRQELHYLIEWEDTDRIEPILASIVRKKIPQEVIKYLSTKINWTNKNKKNEETDKMTNGESHDNNSTSGGDLNADDEHESTTNKEIMTTEPYVEDDDDD